MKNSKNIIYTFILLAISLVGCKTRTLIEYVPIEVEKTVIKKESIRDTIINYVPVKEEKHNTTQPQDTSHLENRYSRSWAFWDGTFLHHNLSTKSDSIPINLPIKETETVISDPVIIKIKGDTVYVNKLEKWQIGLMLLGGVLIGCVGFKLLKLFK